MRGERKGVERGRGNGPCGGCREGGMARKERGEGKKKKEKEKEIRREDKWPYFIRGLAHSNFEIHYLLFSRGEHDPGWPGLGPFFGSGRTIRPIEFMGH